jgi:hypothetical protein
MYVREIGVGGSGMVSTGSETCPMTGFDHSELKLPPSASITFPLHPVYINLYVWTNFKSASTV